RVGTAGLSEREARAIFKPVTETIAFCHRYSVIHRDIKLENVLLDYADEGIDARPLLLQTNNKGSSSNDLINDGANNSRDYRAAPVHKGRVKLIDFGLANFFDGTSLMETFCGSLPYTAPEILRGDAYVGPEIDVWSLGVLLFVMLTGQFPFEDPAQAKNFDKIMAGDFTLPPGMSRELQDLLRRMLQPNSKHRITMRAVLHHPWLMANECAAVAPGICCRMHPFAAADAIHDRRTLLLPGPAISHLVAREVATCLDRSFDDVLRILEAAVANGRRQQHAEKVQVAGNIFAIQAEGNGAVQQWPNALREFYSSSRLVQVPNSPVVSVYALVLQQIGMRRYYLELPATDEGNVKGQSSSSSATMELLARKNNHAATMSSSSNFKGAEATASGGLRDMLDNSQQQQPVPAPSPSKPRTLATRLASHLGNLVSLALGAPTEDLQPPQHWQQAHPSSAAKLKSARALTALELTQPAAAAPTSPMYVQPLSTTGLSMPSLTTTNHHHERTKQPSLASRMRSVRTRSRQPQSLLPATNDSSSDLHVRTIAAVDDVTDQRIALPTDLSTRSATDVLGLVSTLLKLHEIAHTFVETRRMPVHRALMDSSKFPLKTMAAVVASAYPAAQPSEKKMSDETTAGNLC
ncbi:Serine/threonine-protein kinase, partial [Coemansia asiatica]